MMRGLYKKGRGQDPRPDFAAAQEDLDRGVRGGREYPGRWLSSEFLPPWTARARLRIEWAALSGGDPAADWAAAEQDLDRAISFNGRDAEAIFVRGRLRLLQGDRRVALLDFARAVELNPLLEARIAREREGRR
jgi:tetratricopeptide (TPR) repeat protein